jgi:hypothetical protein
VGLTGCATGGAGGSLSHKRAKQAVPGRACAPRTTRAERRAARAVPKRAVPKQPGGLTAKPKHGTVRAPGRPGHD